MNRKRRLHIASVFNRDRRKYLAHFTGGIAAISAEFASGKSAPVPTTKAAYKYLPIELLRVVPGVEGYGATTKAGRGGRVIVVTNNNRSGPGSLADALGQNGPRQIIFDVSGDIVAPPRGFSIKEGQVSVYGQTARGHGICIRAQDEDPYPGVRVLSSDILFQHVRFRAGPFKEINGSRDTVNIGDPNSDKPVSRIVFDHCSMSWGTDETIDIHSGASHVTLSNCLIYEGLAKSTSNHAVTGAGQSGKLLFANSGVNHLSVVNCVLAMSHSRMPLFQSVSKFDFYNNIVYGSTGNFSSVQWLQSSSDSTKLSVVGNFQNNLYIDAAVRRYGGEIVLHGPVAGFSNEFKYKLHVSGNKLLKITDDDEYISDIFIYDASVSRYEAMGAPLPTPRLTGVQAQQLENHLLHRVGASKPQRDSADTRVIAMINAREAAIVDCVDGKVRLQINKLCERNVEWPILKGGETKLGTEPDFVPELWKINNGLKVDADTTKIDSNSDGYFDFEDWLFELTQN